MSELLQGFTREFLSSLFDYDPLTGDVIRRVRRSNRPAGERVGTLDGKGYLHVSVGKQFIRLHRLGWFMTFGEVPAELDHRDNNRQNNALENLRQADRRGQAGNIRPPKHNTSGVKGVSRNSSSGLWHAQIKINGRQRYLGRYATKAEAAEVYELAAAMHFGEFARAG